MTPSWLQLLVLFTLTSGQETSPNDTKDGGEVRNNKFVACSTPAVRFDTCPSDLECERLGNDCLMCNCDVDCQYGRTAEAFCKVPSEIQCVGNRTFVKSFTCQFCYQSDEDYHNCEENVDCDSVADPQSRHHVTNCTVPPDLICLGRRHFGKQKLCNWTGGHRWLTALALSITLGGFGADRFYLGHWQEGIGKLFSFGGLGVWTLVDVVLVAVRYVGPADGSLYI